VYGRDSLKEFEEVRFGVAKLYFTRKEDATVIGHALEAVEQDRSLFYVFNLAKVVLWWDFANISQLQISLATQ